MLSSRNSQKMRLEFGPSLVDSCWRPQWHWSWAIDGSVRGLHGWELDRDQALISPHVLMLRYTWSSYGCVEWLINPWGRSLRWLDCVLYPSYCRRRWSRLLELLGCRVVLPVNWLPSLQWYPLPTRAITSVLIVHSVYSLPSKNHKVNLDLL
jgi:hypothetical protein